MASLMRSAALPWMVLFTTFLSASALPRCAAPGLGPLWAVDRALMGLRRPVMVVMNPLPRAPCFVCSTKCFSCITPHADITEFHYSDVTAQARHHAVMMCLEQKALCQLLHSLHI